MKKFMIPALAAMTALSPMLASPAAALDRQDRRDVREARQDVRDARQDLRQTQRRAARDNGFYANGRFYRGQPTAAQIRARDFRYDYRQWRRGERLSAWDRTHYVRVTDYNRYHLRTPPRGYEYRRSDTGEIILAAIATGVILQVLLNN